MMKFVIAAAVVGIAAARCPNDCSGHGSCGASDMCTCQRNWMAADCSERVCPFGLSFVDTPQGDLDGDTLVEKTLSHTFDGTALCGDTDGSTIENNWCFDDPKWGVLGIERASRKVTSTGFDFGCFGSPTRRQAQTHYCEGLSAGDMITIEGTATANGRNNDGWFIVEQTHTCVDQGKNPGCVKSNADSPNRDNSVQAGEDQDDVSTWIIIEDHRGQIPSSEGATTHRFHGETGVETFQDETVTGDVTITMRGHPVQWSNQLESEYYPHDAQEDEAHFYAECSNKGFCNRKSGECECLPGYEGVGCERTACAGGCSGHGTCEALTDLVHGNNPYQLWDGTNVPKTFGCKCDARWSGPDCSSRVCPMGDDPLTTGQVNEVQQVEINSGAGHSTDGRFALYFTDEFGEVWRTSDINAKAYAAAADQANCVFKNIDRTVTCDGTGLAAFDDEDFITIAGTTAGTMQYRDNANDGEFRVFDPMTTNSRTESISGTGPTTIVFAEGTYFVDYSESADSTFSSFSENPSDNKVTFKRSNGLATALLNIPNDVVQDVEVSIADGMNMPASGSGISYRVTFTSNPGNLPEMICDNSQISGDVHSFVAGAFPLSLGEASDLKISFTAPSTITIADSGGTSRGWLDNNGDGTYATTGAFRDSDHILVTGSTQNDGIYEIQHHPDAVSNTRMLVRQPIRTEAVDSDAEIIVYKQQCQVRSELERVGYYDQSAYKFSGSADGDTDSDCSTLSVTAALVGANTATFNKYEIKTTYTTTEDIAKCDLAKFDIGDQLTIECKSNGCLNNGRTVTVTNKDPTGALITVLAGGSGNDIHGDGRTDKSGDGTDTLVADDATGDDAMTQFFVTHYGHGTTEQDSCSGRGLCDGSSGTCGCFKGYTGDDCSAQNALAM